MLLLINNQLSFSELPVVGYWGLTFAGYEPMQTANINPPSTNPLIVSGLPRKMNFKERLWNFFLFGVNTAIMTVRTRFKEHRIYKYYVMNYSINSFTGASEAPVNVVVVY